MRFLTLATDQGPLMGVFPAGTPWQADLACAPIPGLSLLDLIELGPAGLARAQAALDRPERLQVDPRRVLAPMPEPRRNVMCVGWNYLDHAKETEGKAIQPGRELPSHPAFFTKATTAVAPPFGDLAFPADLAQELDWEVELGVVVGARSRDLREENALQAVFGYTVIHDLSARDLQMGHGGQWFKGKSLDGSCPVGPWIVTADEVPDPQQLNLTCTVNGVVKQAASTSQMIFPVARLLAELSRGMTLLPGDLLATGTPSGVGFSRTPPEFLREGDHVVCAVESIGEIHGRVRLDTV